MSVLQTVTIVGRTHYVQITLGASLVRAKQDTLRRLEEIALVNDTYSQKILKISKFHLESSPKLSIMLIAGWNIIKLIFNVRFFENKEEITKFFMIHQKSTYKQPKLIWSVLDQYFSCEMHFLGKNFNSKLVSWLDQCKDNKKIWLFRKQYFNFLPILS